MDNLKNFRRTNYCGDLRLGDTGKTVSLCGWVQRQRDPPAAFRASWDWRGTRGSFSPLWTQGSSVSPSPAPPTPFCLPPLMDRPIRRWRNI